MASPAAAGPRRPAVLRPFSDLLSVALLVAALAPAAVVFSRLSLWNHYQQPWPAFLCGAACCGLAAVARRPGRLVLLALALGVVAVYATLLQAQPGPGLRLADAQARAQVMEWWRLLRGGEAIHDDLAVSAWTTGLAWLVGMWSAWAALRAGWHWLVLALAGAVLLSSIGYTHNWPSGGLIAFLFAALLFLARQAHRDRREDAARRGMPFSRADGSASIAHAGMVLAGVAGVVAFGWLVPGARWRLPQLPKEHARPPSGSLLAGIQVEHPLSVLHDFGSVLPFSGPVAPGDGVVATVKADEPGYLFGVSYDRYQGSGWTTSAAAGDADTATSSTENGQSGMRVRRSSGLAVQETPPYLSSSPVTVTVTPAEPTTVLLAAGPPVGIAPAEDGELPRAYTQWLKGAPAGEFTALIAASPLKAGTTYATDGLISSADPSDLQQATTSSRGWLAAYTQLPSGLPQRVRDLAARLTAGAANDYERAQRIQGYLRTLPYDANITAPPRGEDGVDYLLFEAGRGYCDYFASAMAVLLRSAGVPARVVVGYVMHERNGDGSFTVREHDAHAWTEVYFQGYGWQRFDATPGGAATFAPGASFRGSSNASLTPSQTQAPVAAPQAAAPSGDTLATPAATSLAAPGDALSVWLLWLALLATAALVTSYALLLRLRDPRRAAFAAWRGGSAAARLLVRAAAPGETPNEYAAAVVRRSPRAGHMRGLAAAYAAARYGPPDVRLPLKSRLSRALLLSAVGLTLDRLRRHGKE
jgi:hypothetical protein